MPFHFQNGGKSHFESIGASFVIPAPSGNPAAMGLSLAGRHVRVGGRDTKIPPHRFAEDLLQTGEGAVMTILLRSNRNNSPALPLNSVGDLPGYRCAMKEITLRSSQTPRGLRRSVVDCRPVPQFTHPRKAPSLKTESRSISNPKPPRMTPPPPPPRPRPSSPVDQPGSAGKDRASLEATLKRAARGDERAWCDLVHAYTARVYALIRAQCNNNDLAEEITQSTFCTVVAKISSYTELGKFEQWLFRIAMNRLRDEMRRRKRQARPVEDESLAALAGAAEQDENPHGAADPAQILALRNAVAQLSDADQQIIHLRHYGGLSFKQIAEILDQPLGTVLARQHRALKKLHELLGGGEQ